MSSRVKFVMPDTKQWPSHHDQYTHTSAQYTTKAQAVERGTRLLRSKPLNQTSTAK